MKCWIQCFMSFAIMPMVLIMRVSISYGINLERSEYGFRDQVKSSYQGSNQDPHLPCFLHTTPTKLIPLLSSHLLTTTQPKHSPAQHQHTHHLCHHKSPISFTNPNTKSLSPPTPLQLNHRNQLATQQLLRHLTATSLLITSHTPLFLTRNIPLAARKLITAATPQTSPPLLRAHNPNVTSSAAPTSHQSNYHRQPPSPTSTQLAAQNTSPCITNLNLLQPPSTTTTTTHSHPTPQAAAHHRLPRNQQSQQFTLQFSPIRRPFRAGALQFEAVAPLCLNFYQLEAESLSGRSYGLVRPLHRGS